ncbi:UNKNOWN [Stylonychia lemnae]|uniref:Uncharacterized protein n=1 Tax=Stylonychia lemnae TaxID=5949 RepID=A0A078B0Y2_STYLE|nr:UNKNOWN [Stylonychia lemnae]|eukprot:CDW86753.1 UNKNOWN [Stylonychia lemnae]
MNQSQSAEKINFKALKEDFDQLMQTLKEQKQGFYKQQQGLSILDQMHSTESGNNVNHFIQNLTSTHMNKSVSLPRIKLPPATSSKDDHSQKSLYLGKNPSQHIIRSVKYLVDDNSSKKSEMLQFTVRPPWRKTSIVTNEPLSKYDVQPLSPRNMKARDIYIESNLILPRSIKDAKIDGKTPFKLNTRYDHREYEVPPEQLLGKSQKKQIHKMIEDYEGSVKRQMNEDEKSHHHRRQLYAIKNILECQTSREEKQILEKTLDMETKFRESMVQQDKASVFSKGTTFFMQNPNNTSKSIKILNNKDQMFGLVRGPGLQISLRGSIYDKSQKQENKTNTFQFKHPHL